MTNLNIQSTESFKKASNKTAITKDVLVKRISDRVAKLKIDDSVNQESGQKCKTLTIRYGSRALGTVQQPEGITEADFRASVQASVMASTSLREQAWEMYQAFSLTNSNNAGGQR